MIARCHLRHLHHQRRPRLPLLLQELALHDPQPLEIEVSLISCHQFDTY